MERDSGYYWVVTNTGFKVGQYHKDLNSWLIVGALGVFQDDDFFNILPEPILSPPEMAPLYKAADAIASRPEDIPDIVKRFVEKNPGLYKIFFQYFRGME